MQTNNLLYVIYHQEKFNMPGLNAVAEHVAQSRYFMKDQNGNYTEDWKGLVTRVVNHVCKNETEEFKSEIFDLMYETKFLPNSPCLVNAGRGTKSGGLLACFVTKEPEDSWLGMVENIANFGHIARQGGGCGMSLSKIRPEGDSVFGSTHAKACGPIEHMRMISEIMAAITQSGFRSMAMMATLDASHPEVEKFIVCKQRERALKTLLKEDIGKGYFSQLNGKTHEHLNIVLDKFISNFNISVVVSDKFMEQVKNDGDWNLVFGGKVYKTVKAKDLFNSIAENAWRNGDPGLLFYDRMNDGPYKHSEQTINATNPCVAGETLVAVADGRVAVPIKDLAEKGDDVPVYCRNNHGSVSIRMMRRPRLSGVQKQILKITVEGGHVIRVTSNHKIVLSNGEAFEAKDLEVGDSLSIMTKLCAPFEDVLKKWNSKSQNYYWINSTGKKSWLLDHRLIHNFYNKTQMKGGVIHHEDYNGLNNSISNLKYMSKKEHDDLHRADKMGDKNPMRRAATEWSEEKWATYRLNMSRSVSGLKNGRAINITNKDLFNIAVNETKKLGHKMTCADWQKYALANDIVSQFSDFRTDELGSISDFLTNAAAGAGIDNSQYSGAILREYKIFLELETDLDVFFDQTIKVRKKCEFCNNTFVKPYYQRETAYCSMSCSNSKKNRSDKQKQACLQSMSRIREKKRVQLLKTYQELASTLGRQPMKKEFEQLCKKTQIPFRLPSTRERESGKLIGCFNSWKDLVEQSTTFNHKIIKIEEDLPENVYTGTVDDYHNFYIGHFEELHNERNSKFIYINNLQCGEQILPNWGACNLGSIDVSKFIDGKDLDWKSLRSAIRITVQFLDDVIDVNTFPTSDFHAWSQDNRPIGLGIMGFADLLLKLKMAYGSEESLFFAKKLAKFFQDEAHAKSVELGKIRGTPKCCKYPELEFRRNVTTISIAPTGSISLLAGCSSSIEPIFASTTYRQDNTGSYVIPHPDADKHYFKCALNKENPSQEVPWKEHVLMQAAFQEFVDSGLSKTINFPNSATVEDVKNAYMLAYEQKCKGITVYRDGSKTVQVLNSSSVDGLTNTNFHAPSRGRELPCNIHKVRADGFDWHILIGLKNGVPYELFAVNGSVDLPETGKIVKVKKQHYSLLDNDDTVLINNLANAEERIDPRVSLETRRFSLELRHGIPSKYIVHQIDKSHETLSSFSKAAARIMKKHYLSYEDHISIAGEISCPNCRENGRNTDMICESGCWRCPDNSCGYSKCG